MGWVYEAALTRTMGKKRLKGHKYCVLGPIKASFLFEPFRVGSNSENMLKKRDNSSEPQSLLQMTVQKPCVIMKSLYKIDCQLYNPFVVV